MPCNGDCCVAFPMSADVLERCAAGTVMEGDVLLAMLIPLTPQEAQERRDRFGVERPIDARETETQGWFMCKHWDEETRLCGNYEGRPHTCSCYPYGRQCDHGCDCDHDWSAIDAVG